MSGAPLTLEEGAVSAVAQLAAQDVARALRAIDASAITADDFADAHARAVWAAVETQVREGRSPDFINVQARVGGVPRDRLVRMLLDDSTPGEGWLRPTEERLGFVREAADRRRIGRVLSAARELVIDTTRPLAEALAEAQRALEAIQHRTVGVRTLDVEVVGLVDHLEEVRTGQRPPVLATGLEALDAAVGGLQPTLTVVGALPGVGKSGLLAAIVRNLAARGVTSGVLSLEDEARWLPMRLLSEVASVPVFVLANRPLGDRQAERVTAAAADAYTRLAHVLIDDRAGMSTADVVASARTMLVRGARALFLDHLGEIRLNRSDRHDLDIADALQQLRGLSKVYRVPVVVFCHLRRRDGLTPKDEPRLTDFAFSAAVERMARVALALARPDEETLRVFVLKQTQGKAGVAVDLPFNGPAGVVANESAPGIRAKADGLYDGPEGPDR